MTWRTEWWALQLDRVAKAGKVDIADAVDACFDYLDESERGEPNTMTFDAWCDRMAVLPALSIDDVEEILAHPKPTAAIALKRWLDEANAKTTP